jgi:hypothetical protein
VPLKSHVPVIKPVRDNAEKKLSGELAEQRFAF